MHSLLPAQSVLDFVFAISLALHGSLAHHVHIAVIKIDFKWLADCLFAGELLKRQQERLAEPHTNNHRALAVGVPPNPGLHDRLPLFRLSWSAAALRTMDGAHDLTKVFPVIVRERQRRNGQAP